MSLATDLGLASLSDRSSLSGGLRVGRRWLGNRGYSLSAGPWQRGTWQVSEITRVGVAGDLLGFRHDDVPGRDGWRLSIRPNLFHALDRRSTMAVALDLESMVSRQRHFGSRMAGLEVTVTHVFEGGLSVAPTLGVWFRRYGGRDPLFDRVRKDTTIRPAVTIRHQSLHAMGLTPHVGYRFETVRSSLDIHSFGNHAVEVGVSRTF